MGFADISSGDWTVKAMFGCIAVALVGGILTAYYSVQGPGTAVGNDYLLKCADCGTTNTYTSKEFSQLSNETTTAFIQKSGNSQEMMMMMMQPQWGVQVGFKCTGCGKGGVDQKQDGKPHGMYIHYTCPKDQTVFPYQAGSYTDKCPKCGYSAQETRIQEKLKKNRAK